MKKINIARILESRLLPFVERPAQYVGGEYNSIIKDWEKTAVKMAFLFPDSYEIGMSHLGTRILYHAVNSRDNMLMERAFAPLKDMETLMRKEGLPLFSWESKKQIRDFDVVGFTLQYELSYTNILNMLNLSALPLEAEHREGFPLIIAGGPGTFNPEPLADFIDAFLIGEAEESLPEFLSLIGELKAKGMSKAEILLQTASLKGVYIPSLYGVKYDSEGNILSLSAFKGAPPFAERRVIKDISKAPFPENALIPSIRAVHDRIMLEIMRGCGRGCRFCQAGIIYRPVREKNSALLLEQAHCLVNSTGYDEIGLISLSSADYTEIEDLISLLLQEYEKYRIGVSLPSLRVDAFSVKLAEKVHRVRKSGLTFAPEAGSQRLRDIINKRVGEEEIFSALSSAFKEGWSSVKLYFMLGLPGETDEDIIAVSAMCRKIAALYRERKPPGKGKPLKVSLGIASFVPKPHTPFQWYGQIPREELLRRQNLLKESFRGLKAFTLSFHSVNESALEAAFARGGRYLGKVLKAAWEKGCSFDGWREHFRFDLWLEAFAESGFSLADEAEKQFSRRDILPWSHIRSGVNEEWLWNEKLKSEQALTTPDCRSICNGCGICENSGAGNILQGKWQNSAGENNEAKEDA